MSDKARIKELEERLAIYEKNPIAEFYAQLALCAKKLQGHMRTGTLDLEKDVYQISIFTLLKDADKIFISMDKGKKVFEVTEEEEVVVRRGKRSTTLPL